LQLFQILLRSDVVGVDAQGLLELGDGLGESTLRGVDHAQVIVRFRMAGIQSHGPFQMGLGLG
jgi:hypothetical protein